MTFLHLQKFIAKDGQERRVLSVHIVSTQKDENATTTAEEEESAAACTQRHTTINDIVAFKSCKELYPIAMPFLDIKAKGARSKL